MSLSDFYDNLVIVIILHVYFSMVIVFAINLILTSCNGTELEYGIVFNKITTDQINVRL